MVILIKPCGYMDFAIPPCSAVRPCLVLAVVPLNLCGQNPLVVLADLVSKLHRPFGHCLASSHTFTIRMLSWLVRLPLPFVFDHSLTALDTAAAQHVPTELNSYGYLSPVMVARYFFIAFPFPTTTLSRCFVRFPPHSNYTTTLLYHFRQEVHMVALPLQEQRQKPVKSMLQGSEKIFQKTFNY